MLIKAVILISRFGHAREPQSGGGIPARLVTKSLLLWAWLTSAGHSCLLQKVRAMEARVLGKGEFRQNRLSRNKRRLDDARRSESIPAHWARTAEEKHGASCANS